MTSSRPDGVRKHHTASCAGANGRPGIGPPGAGPDLHQHAPSRPENSDGGKMKTSRYIVENFPGTSDLADDDHPRNRKRKFDGHEGAVRVVRTTWDMEAASTAALFTEMGVCHIDEGDDDDDQHDDDDEGLRPAATPHVIIHHDLLPPGAPKVTVLPNPSVNLAIGGYVTATNTTTPPTFLDLQSAAHLPLISRKLVKKELIPGDNEWNQLSDEMILNVFKWLPKQVLARCMRVCKRWNRLACDETLWRRVDLANRTVKPGVLGRVLDRGVIVLRCTRSEIKSPVFVENPYTVQPRFSRVQYLDLSMATVSTEGLEQLFSTCYHLRKLSLENCELNDTICRYIGQNRNLEVLSMSMCQGITENGLVPICNNLQRLEALNVGWTNMSRGAVLYLVICLPPSLIKLNLSGCRETLEDEDVQQLCQNCPHMKELDLSDATLLTSASVEHIASMLCGLEYVALSRCYHMAPSSLPLLGNILTLLAVDVFGMLKESALNQLRASMANIEINKFPFSSIARPTTGIRRTSIWGLRVRDIVY